MVIIVGTRLPGRTAAEKARALLAATGVAAVAGSAFFRPGRGEDLLRFCFAKQDAELDAACERLRRTYPGLADAVPVVRSWWIKPLEIVGAREHGTYLRACNANDGEQLRYLLHIYPQAVHWHGDWNGQGGTNGLGACIRAGGHAHRVAAMLLSAGININ